LKLPRGDQALSAVGPPRLRRVLRLVVVAGVLVAAGVWGWRWLANAPVEVDEATVTTAYPYQSLAALTSTGYVVAQRKAAVASKATGRLEWLGVAEGSRVRRGEVIARLESADVSAARDQAAAALKVAQANLEQARVEAQDARRALARASELLERRFVSEAVHDQAQARLDKAAAGVRSQDASVAVARANLRAAEVSLEQTLIRAPFDGVVLTKSADVGDVVTPFSSSMDAKGAVVTMADMATLEVEADVSESNLARVRPGQPVEIQLDALPDRRFRGVVSRTVPTVDRSKATVMTKIRFVDTDARVLPEMSAKAIFLEREVSEAERSPRTAVQAAALTKRDGADVAFVVTDGKARLRPVRIGVTMADLVEVVDGLSPGEKVVLRPGPRLLDGAAVRPARR
jgi:RND family efflux transporter MFP subunit